MEGHRVEGALLDEVAFFEKKREDAIADLLAKGTADLDGVIVNLVQADDQLVLDISTPILGCPAA